ncbi:hypothetical protein BGZ65_012189, partial [Modicella reniformis]
MNEEAVVLFVTDDHLQDSPPLTFTPGVVFKVLVTDNDQGSSSLESNQSINVVGSYNTQSSSMITRDDINTMDNDTDSQSLAEHSQASLSVSPTALITSSKRGATFPLDPLTPCQVNAGTSSIQITDGQIDTVQWETDIDMAQQEHLQEVQHTDQQTHGAQTQQSVLLKIDLDCDNSIANSTGNIVINLNMINHFKLEISPLSLVVGVNKDGIRYFEMM